MQLLLKNNSGSFRRLGRSLKRISHTHYPSFITGRAVKETENLVFVYHDVTSESFESDLSFLKKNGYNSVGIADFVREYKKRHHDKNQRNVLLTFDDARKNFFQIAFPLLKKYNLRATVFVPTLWVNQRENADKSWSPTTCSNLFMDWNELRLCNDSGLVDVESHGWRHALIYTSPVLEAFATPELLKNHDIFDWPMRRDAGRDILGKPELGTPLYGARPLLSANYRLMEDERVAKICSQFVCCNGGENFFKKKGWYNQLLSVFKKDGRLSNGFKEVAKEDYDSEIRNEFVMANKEFMREFGRLPSFFAFPWELGTKTAIRVAGENGIQAIFGVGMDYARVKKIHSTIPSFYRIKGEWLRFLPGRGRKNLGEMLFEKLLHFTTTQHLVH